jgi:hypothetical protein
MSETMQALVLYVPVGPEVLRVQDIEKPRVERHSAVLVAADEQARRCRLTLRFSTTYAAAFPDIRYQPNNHEPPQLRAISSGVITRRCSGRFQPMKTLRSGSIGMSVPK